MWAGDRLHLSTDGHRLVADAVLNVLGVSSGAVAADRQETLVGQSWLAARRSDAQWAGTYFAPWVGRKLRGRSSGDLLDPKLPELTAVPVLPRPRKTVDRPVTSADVGKPRSSR
jgi:hypothetical protein